MRIVRGWSGLPPEARCASVALGNFDGVHRGHQRVIDAAKAAAAAYRLPVGAVVFDPHPRVWFQPHAAPFRLQSDAQRARALGELGVDLLYVLPFDAVLAGMSDEGFAREVLSDGLAVRHVSAGFDITFGKDRSGDGAALRTYGARLGFGATIVEPVEDGGGEKLSSSAVRLALEAGRPEQAAAILGRPFAIEGAVQRGAQRGRALGFPTANVPLGDYVRPRFGVYATRTRLADGRVLDGVSNVGVNPQFGAVEPRLEAWLFDFDEAIYGQVIETELIAFLRPEETFADVEALRMQVFRDAEDARTALATRA